jgi:hypothetical protein
MNSSIVAAAILALLSACASTPPVDYTAFLQHMPKSILVLPAINDSIEAAASAHWLPTISQALGEHGYYVFPVAVVDAVLRQNGAPTPADMQAISREKLREFFGADAALLTRIREWGTSYQVVWSSSRVAVDCQLVDLATGVVLWQGEGSAVRNSDGGGHPIGMLAAAIVEQVVSTLDDRCPDLARQLHNDIVTDGARGLPLGPRHPDFERDQARRRGTAAGGGG